MTEITKGHVAVRLVEVTEDSDGQRIDNFLIKNLKGVPKSKIYRCMRKGEVRVNGGRIKAQAKLKSGDVVRIPPIRASQEEVIRASDKFLNILDKSIIYEDKRMLILNKKIGIAVHGGSGLQLGAIEGLRQLRPELKFLELVHRLDRDTSGCLMVAKKRSTLKQLQAFLSNKTELGKHYQAIVHGRWPKRKQHLAYPIRKNTLPNGERVCIVAADGKPSLTEVDIIAQNSALSLLAVRPITGRTHQIRVHCKHVGHPIVGDEKYGHEVKDKEMKHRGFTRLMLHALRLEIPALDVGDKPISIEAEPGEAFLNLIKTIK